jgi:cation transport ATPase
MDNNKDEFSDSIELFKPRMHQAQQAQIEQFQQPQQQAIQQAQMQQAQQAQMQQAMQQAQQQAMQQAQQQAMQQAQQQAQQQAMQQAQMQQAMQQAQQQAMQQAQNFKDKSWMDRLSILKNNKTIQEIFVISILYIVFSTPFYKELLTKYIPFTGNSCDLNTIGLLISSLAIAVIIVIIKTFI